MTDRMTFRTFPTAFKLAAIKRLEPEGWAKALFTPCPPAEATADCVGTLW
jgi:hypothetical protein